MKSTILLAIGLTSAAFLSGCATQKTASGQRTDLAFGLVSVESGSYQSPSPNTIDINTNDHVGNQANTKGLETKLFWGLFTFNDY